MTTVQFGLQTFAVERGKWLNAECLLPCTRPRFPVTNSAREQRQTLIPEMQRGAANEPDDKGAGVGKNSARPL